MRGLAFAFCGALIGGLSALLLGLLFGSGIEQTMAFEMGIYVFCGLLLGCAIGGLVHVVTKGSGRMDAIAAPPRQPASPGAAAAVVLVVGLASAGMSLMRLMNAPPGTEGMFIGSLVGGLVGTAFGVVMMLRRK
jgi:hypothetical protein